MKDYVESFSPETVIMFVSVESLNTTISAMEKEHRDKYQFSNEFEKTLREMLKAQKHDQSTQVYEHELAWDATQLVPRQRLDNLNVGAQNTIDMGVNVVSEASKDERSGASNAGGRAGTLLSKAPVMHLEAPGDRVPLERAGSFVGEDGQQPNQKAFQLEFGLLKNFIWQLPPSTVVFLKNCIESKETVQIRPWMAVRRDIDEFYAFLLSASEIEPLRFIVTTSIEDLLILFFLQKYKLRRLAEKRLMEFVVSLKYYCKQKTRALNCALVCSLVTAEDARAKRPSSIPDFDMYFQGFFLHVLKVVEDLGGKLTVAQEDISYIDVNQAIKVSEAILQYFEPEIKEGFISRLKSCITAFVNEDLAALRNQIAQNQAGAGPTGQSSSSGSGMPYMFNHQMVQQLYQPQTGTSLANLPSVPQTTGPLSLDLDKLIYVFE